jgi:hypothetical protein
MLCWALPLRVVIDTRFMTRLWQAGLPASLP